MPGNRAIYDRAMQQSRDAAQQSKWEDALKNAARALQEYPQDTDARIAAGVALFQTDKLAQALQIFSDLYTSNKQNAFFLDYMARIYERQQNTPEAVKAYHTLADINLSQRVIPKAIEALRAVLRLNPQLDDQRIRLAELFEQMQSTRDAAAEYLTLARTALNNERFDKAQTFAETVLKLDPSSRDAKEIISTVNEAKMRSALGGSEAASALPSTAGSVPPKPRSTPIAVEQTITKAQERQEAGDLDGAIDLYEQLLQAGVSRADVSYSLGTLYQDRNNHAAAVNALQAAAQDPEFALSAFFGLGTSQEALDDLTAAATSYEQALRLIDLDSIGRAEVDDLIKMYERASAVYEKIGDVARAGTLLGALAGFLQGKRWGKEMATQYQQRARELAERTMLAKLRTLSTGGLKSEMPETIAPPRKGSTPLRPGTGSLHKTGTNSLSKPPTSPFSTPSAPSAPASFEPFVPSKPALARIAPKPSTSQIANAATATIEEKVPIRLPPPSPLDTAGLDEQAKKWLVVTDRYIEQGMLEAALDACHEVIRIDMEYLPVHLRMGEIHERQGDVQEALTKYQLLVEAMSARQQPEQAIPVYKRLVELSPDTITVRVRLADILKQTNRMDEAAAELSQVAASYFRIGQTNRALDEYRRLLQWAPKDPYLHSQYGMVLLKLERYEAALSEFRRALSLGANDPATVARIATTLTLMQEDMATVWDSFSALLDTVGENAHLVREAQTEYRSALLIADNPLLHYMLGLLQQRNDEHESALLSFQQANMALEPGQYAGLSPVLLLQAAGESCAALGRTDEALEYFDQAYSQAATAPATKASTHPFANPLPPSGLARRMAQVCIAAGDLALAEQTLLEARKQYPEDRELYTLLADIYFQQGKLTDAVKQLEALATAYEDRQNLDRAITTLEQAQSIAPSNISVANRLARLLIRRGYPDRGVDGLVRAAELQRKAGQIKDAVASLQQAAEVLWTLGKVSEAQAIFGKISQIAPNDIEVRQWLAFMYTLNGRPQEAIAEKKQIVRILTELREYDNAIAELHQVIGLNQQDIEAYYLLGDMLMRREEYAQAVQLYARLLKLETKEPDRVKALIVAASRMLEQQGKAKSATS